MIKESVKEAVDKAYEAYVESQERRGEESVVDGDRLLVIKATLSVLVQDMESVWELVIASNALSELALHYLQREEAKLQAEQFAKSFVDSILNQLNEGENDGKEVGADEEEDSESSELEKGQVVSSEMPPNRSRS